MKLSKREREANELLMLGLTRPEVARRMGIAIGTLYLHTKSIRAVNPNFDEHYYRAQRRRQEVVDPIGNWEDDGGAPAPVKKEETI